MTDLQSLSSDCPAEADLVVRLKRGSLSLAEAVKRATSPASKADATP